MSVRISAIICTFNRAGYLRKALQSLVEQTLPKTEYEILVIDNCSTDNTQQIVCEDFAHVPNLRYLHEPILGVSQARNTGWRSATSNYVAYLDDDAIASPYWLEKILDVFENVKPKPGCVGGKIEPIWEAPRPSWLCNYLTNFLSMLDLSEVATTLNDGQWLVGTNIAYPKSILENVGGYEISIGRKGKCLLSLEENVLQEQIISKGYSRFYCPEIIVRHHVPASRVNKGWFTRRLYWEGISASKAQVLRESPSSLKRLKLGIYQICRLLLSPKRLLSLAIRTDTSEPDTSEQFAQQCLTLSQIGYLLGILGIAG